MHFSTKAANYFLNLKTPDKIFNKINVINPYESKEVRKAVKEFFNKFYGDNKERLFMIGINPGRFGGGLTGISFTDPFALREYCGIPNNLGNRKELSSKFIYEMIAAFGGVEEFFSKVFMTALFPLALIAVEMFSIESPENFIIHILPWFVFPLAGILNGVLLEATYRELIGDLPEHHISTATGIIFFVMKIKFLFPGYLRINSLVQSVIIKMGTILIMRCFFIKQIKFKSYG